MHNAYYFVYICIGNIARFKYYYIMEKLSLYDLCVIAKSLYVDFSKLTYEEGDKIYLPNSTGAVKADMVEVDNSHIEYNKISILIRVLQDIYSYRPLPF